MVNRWVDRTRRDPESRPDAAVRRRRRRTFWLIGLVLLLTMVVLGVVMALQARAAYTHLRAAEAQAPELRRQILTGDDRQLRERADEIAGHTEQARSALAGPHWAAAAALPFIGSDVSAIRTVTTVADDLAGEALPQLVRAAGVVSPQDLRPRDGRFALAPLRAAGPHLESAARTTEAARTRIDEVAVEDLATPLRDRYADVAAKVESLSVTMDVAAGTTRILPGLLGGDGPRRYLVLLQNNSEPRSLGGIAGSVIELRADKGRIKLVGQRTGGSFGRVEEPVLKLTPAEIDLYGTQLGTFMQNVTGTPDFTRTAELARAHWKRVANRPVDGVAALDPVALDALLAATGPVTLPDGSRLRSGEAAELLLNRVYFDIADPAQQDEYFAQAASTMFSHVIAGNLDVPTAVDTLTTAAERGRFLFWPQRATERDVLAGTALTGPLADPDEPTVGVFIHDRTASKMGFYQRVEARTAPVSCRADDDRVDVTVDVTSTAPDASELPAYVTGNGSVVPRGHIASRVYLFAPAGAEFSAFVASGGPKRAVLRNYLGRQVASWPFELAPGESVSVDYRIEGVERPLDELQIRVTPGPTEGQFLGIPLPCGS